MNRIDNATVAEIAASSLAAVKVFEKYGIDYCCGGKRPLTDVCHQSGKDTRLVMEELETALRDSPVQEYDWSNTELHQLINHIVTVHHGFLYRELPAIQMRLDKVYRVYNQRYGPTLTGLPEVFAELRAELDLHMRKEETVLFPAIRAIEIASKSGEPTATMPFGTIANPIRMMETEHDSAGNALRRIHEITNDFATPEYACVTYKALMSGLAELEQDLHMHIHLENNVLFPRTMEIESVFTGSV